MLNPQEACLESQAERIARIITREYGVEVRIEGTKAFIDLKKRVLVIPDMTKKEIAKLGPVLDGFLDHECGHALELDVEAFEKAGFKSGEPIHSVWNIIEDYWTDRELGKRYVGCGQNIRELDKAVAVHTRAIWDDCDSLNKLLFALQQIWRGLNVEADYASDPEVGALLPLLATEIKDGYAVNSTFEAIELARRILAKIQDLSDQAPKTEPQLEEQPEPQAGEEEQESGGGEGESGDRGDDTQGDGGDSDEQEDPEDHEGDSGDSEGSHDERGEGEDGDFEDGNGDIDTDADGELQEGESGDDGEPKDGLVQAADLQELLDSGEQQECKIDAENFFNQNLDNIRDTDTDRYPEEYLVYSTQYDMDIEYSAKDRNVFTEKYWELKKEVNDYIGNMAVTLALSLTAETEARWVGGARRGRKWDKRRMPQWFLGGDDDRVWKGLEQDEKWDTAVTLLWDCSGSMGSNWCDGSKSALARLAAIAFHEALTRANIPHEVLGFNTGGDVPKKLRVKVSAAINAGIDLDRYSRLDDTDKRMVFVPFGSDDGRPLCKIDGGAANRDGECVMWAAKRLAQRPEKRKILIVGSDGQPKGARYRYTEKKYLQTVVREVINSGIEILAIGIMNPAVKKYYPTWVLIEKAADIPTVVIRELSQQLFARGTNNVKFPEFCKRPSRGGRV